MNSYFTDIILRGNDLWPAFHDKRVFIGGGTGFFGSWFTHLFKTLNVPVESRGRRNDWDITNPSTFSTAQKEADIIFHLAFPVAEGLVSEDKMYDVVVAGTRNLIAAAKSGAKILFVSTGAVHDSSSYLGQLKKEAEDMVLNAGGQVVRPFATVGPGMSLNAHFAISHFIQNKLDNKPLEVSSYPIYRSFAHIIDVVIQTMHVALLGDGKPYDVGSDSVLTIEQAAKVISSNIAYTDKVAPSYAGAFHVANLQRIRHQFNLDLSYSSEAAIADTLRYYENRSSDILFT